MNKSNNLEKGLTKLFGRICISQEEGKDCYNHPCVCLVCKTKTYCTEDPCIFCGGKETDRKYEFCSVSEEEPILI